MECEAGGRGGLSGRLLALPGRTREPCDEFTLNEVKGGQRGIRDARPKHESYIFKKRPVGGLGCEVLLELGPGDVAPLGRKVVLECGHDAVWVYGGAGHGLPEIEEIAALSALVERAKLGSKQLVQLEGKDLDLTIEPPGLDTEIGPRRSAYFLVAESSRMCNLSQPKYTELARERNDQTGFR